MVVRREPDEDKGSAAPQRPVRVAERLRRDRQRDGRVGAAESLDRGGRIFRGRVDRELRPQLTSERELVLLEIDRDHACAGDAGVLHGQVAEAPDPEDCDQVGRPRPRHLHGLVRRDPGACQRCRVQRIDPGRHPDREARRRLHELGEAAVDRVAGVSLLRAQRLPAGDAVVASSAGVAEPRNRDAVAHGELGHAGADDLDDPDALVTGHERRRRLHRPVSVRGVDVGVTEPGGLDPDEDLSPTRDGRRDLLEPQWLRERMHHRGLHRGRRVLAERRAPLEGRGHRDLLS